MLEDQPFYLSFLNFDVDAFLNLAGTDPFTAMGYLFLNGGWILFVVVFLFLIREGWLEYRQNKFLASREWVLLKITVPKTSEQTVKAVENIFANFAGAHSPASWTEKWFQGMHQMPLSIEIASIEGDISFYIHCLKQMRDLVEASIYAQYPDAEIELAEDYAKNVPSKFPDEEWDAWGCEMTNVMPDPYPLKTYPEFEDKISGEFKDPLAVLLENFSRLGKGEQAWYQIVITPTDQKEERKRAEKVINKFKGIKEEAKKNIIEQAIEIPAGAAMDVLSVAMGSTIQPKKKEEKKDGTPKILQLSPGEKYVLEAIERKVSKIGFLSKIRFIYVAKKENMSKAKVVNAFIGAIKQTNTFNMQALKPETKRVGVNGTLWWFKDKRNNGRKRRLILGYRNRSDTSGLHRFMLCSEELATLWHFPILQQVRAPQLRRVEAKKGEPPPYIPFG